MRGNDARESLVSSRKLDAGVVLTLIAGGSSAAISVRTTAATSLRELTRLSRASLPRILHRRRQDDNDDGAQREARDRHRRAIPQQSRRRWMAQLWLMMDMPATVRGTT